jgi:hypothetical protein
LTEQETTVMRGDTTRNTFRRVKHFRHVLRQQGRVDLDAEWNEQRDIDDHLRATTTEDVLGPSAAPLHDAGFDISIVTNEVMIGAGRYYLGGLLAECEETVALDAQPDLPDGLPLAIDTDGDPLAPPTAGVYLAELDVWTRQLTALDDSELREIAVPVPDTTTRAKTVWQVRLVRVGASGSGLTCASPVPAWEALRAPADGRMQARAEPGDDAATPCEVPEGAGFRRSDNQHYRVEIHDPGPTGTGTFKFSRENGSVQARWIAQDVDRLTVEIPSRDEAVGFAPGDWIELVDDVTDLGALPGVMVRVATVDGDVIEVDLPTATGGTVDFTTMGPNPKVRRWESAPISLKASWTDLESGVQVRFETGKSYRTADHWSVPARTAINDVLWPQDGGGPAALLPLGIEHRYGRLAMLAFDGTTWTVTEDCRPLFPPATELVTLRYVGGDGQHAKPDPTDATILVPLAEQLRVAVANGGNPKPGALVRFTVTTGGGQIDVGAGPVTTATVATGADGTAACSWSVESATALQRVTALLVDSGGTAHDVPVIFSASLLHASGVAFGPSDCLELAGATDVQQAIDALCHVGGEGCSTIVVTPMDGWDEPLRALPEGASARICFRPGEYKLGDPLVLTKLGHLLLDGAGPGSLVFTEESETALRFEACASVTIRDLAVRAGATASPQQNGAVTTIGCPEVELTSASLTCGAGGRRAVTCLTVRPASPGLTSGRVRVHDCSFTVGHLQTAMLIVDADMADVAGNVIQVARKPPRLGIKQLLADPLRRRKLIGQLIARPLVAERSSLVDRTTVLRVGEYAVRFDSAVPREAWANLLEENPPVDADLSSAEAVHGYVTELADRAVAEPATFPAFDRRVAGLRASVGDEEFDALLRERAGRAAVRGMLVGGGIEVVEESALPELSRTTRVALGEHRVLFDSPVPATTWANALRAADVAESSSNAALRNDLYKVASRVLLDEDFRARHPAFKGWYDGLVDNNPACASSGIVCAGRFAHRVDITDNHIDGVIEAVRVAVSHRAPPDAAPDRAGTVHVARNHCTLRVPLEQFLGSQGMFFGNVDRLTVQGNVVRMTATDIQEHAYVWGIKVGGHLGHRLDVSDNVVEHCQVGIKVEIRFDDPQPPHRWVVRDNVAPSTTHPVDVPSQVQATGNVGF